VKKFEASGQLKLMLGCAAKRLVTEPGTGRVTGVEFVDTSTGQQASIAAHNTVLATGGFANDRTNTSLLAKHRPDLVRFVI
jgi:succinate dehydrogenase/fumarate reductase flavoprotein subunit